MPMLIKNRGFTLIEAIIFIVIVSVAVTAITLQFAQNVQTSAEPLIRQKGMAIAKRYLDQMQTVRWDENTPVGGGTATSTSTPGLDAGETCTLSVLDDFDDFDCFNNNALADGFSIDITVTNGTSIGAWDSVPANSYKRAVINVGTPTNETLRLTIFRANY